MKTGGKCRGRTPRRPIGALAAIAVATSSVLGACQYGDAQVAAAPAGPTSTGPTSTGPTSTGNIERGIKLFRKCVSCHSLERNGPNKVGPRLYGLFGRVSGAVPDFKYSPSLRAARIVWDEDSLGLYLANTTAMVPGTKMYAFMSREQDRTDLVAYLREATAVE